MTITNTGTSAFYERATLTLQSLRERAEAYQGQIGRGERLTRSSDDPVAASRLRSLARADRLGTIDLANADRVRTDLTLADTTLSDFADFIVRARELATQAASGTLNPDQRAAIGAEMAQIHGHLVSLANARDSSGFALFGGETAGNAYALDGLGNASYVGTASAGTIALGEDQSVERGVTGPEFLDFDVAGTPTNLLAAVKALGEALSGAVADPAGAARDALTTLSAGLDAVTTTQTVVGSRLAWIDLSTERQTEFGELRAEEEADIGGTDIAATVVKLQEILVVLEASQASFTRLAGVSLFDNLR